MITPPSPRLVGDDPRTADAAKALWATFNEAEDAANAEYFKAHGGASE